MTPITGLHRILPKFLQVISPISLIPRHLRVVPPLLYFYTKFQSVLLCEWKTSRAQSPFSFSSAEDSDFKEKSLKRCPTFFSSWVNYLTDSEPPTALLWWVNVSSFPPLYYHYISSVHTHRDWNIKSSLLKKVLTNLSHAVSLHTFFTARVGCVYCRQDSQRIW